MGEERGKLHRMMQAAVEFDTSTPEAIANSFASLACQQLRYVVLQIFSLGHNIKPVLISGLPSFVKIPHWLLARPRRVLQEANG